MRNGPKNPPEEELDEVLLIHCPMCGMEYLQEDGHHCPDSEKEDEDEFDESDILSDLD